MNGQLVKQEEVAQPTSAMGRFFQFSSPNPLSRRWQLYSFERDIILTVKGVILLILCYYLFLTNWMEDPPVVHQEAFGETIWRLAQRVVQYAFILYAAVNIATAFLLIGMQDIPGAVLQWILMLAASVDAAFLGGLVLVTGGIESALFWLFPFLIARNAISAPDPGAQILLNGLTCVAYAAAVTGERLISMADIVITADSSTALQLGAAFYLRLLLLVTVALWLLGLRILIERQRRQEEEQAEMMLRSEQLHATGRLAAEIAHKLKNPLAIINNASFTLQRTVKEGKGTITQQIEIIREEVDRSDRLITELMGFSQLVEGRVERLDLKEELERAIREVFPPAVNYEVSVRREYGAGIPPLLLQRQHLGEVLINLLQNARDVMKGRGEIWVRTRQTAEQTVEISVTDNGPGIPPENLPRVFEPYFTTRDKGSGLGLAIVQHNVEMYGGQARVESELGRGTTFTIEFPAKSMMRLRK